MLGIYSTFDKNVTIVISVDVCAIYIVYIELIIFCYFDIYSIE